MQSVSRMEFFNPPRPLTRTEIKRQMRRQFTRGLMIESTVTKQLAAKPAEVPLGYCGLATAEPRQSPTTTRARMLRERYKRRYFRTK